MEENLNAFVTNILKFNALRKAKIHFARPRSVLVALEINLAVTQSCAHKTRYQSSGFLRRKQEL